MDNKQVKNLEEGARLDDMFYKLNEMIDVLNGRDGRANPYPTKKYRASLTRQFQGTYIDIDIRATSLDRAGNALRILLAEAIPEGHREYTIDEVSNG